MIHKRYIWFFSPKCRVQMMSLITLNHSVHVLFLREKNTFWFSRKLNERLLFSRDSWTPSHGNYLGIYSQMSDDTSRCMSITVTQVSYSSAKAPFHLLNVPFVVYCRKAIYPFFRSQYLYMEWLTDWHVGLSNEQIRNNLIFFSIWVAVHCLQCMLYIPFREST